MKSSILVVTLVLSGLAASAAAAEPSDLRSWTDATGKFKIEARLVGADRQSVHLQRADGTHITVAIARLSAADQEVLKTLLEPRELKQDDGHAAGKKSIAGGGHAVRFETAGDSWSVTSVRLHGSRYGHPQPPREDFTIWICDDNLEVIAEHGVAYGKVPYGARPQWVALPIPPTKVPAKFVICLAFNPTQTKGVYVSYDAAGSGNSMIGVPSDEMRPMESGDWMIRPTIEMRGPSPNSARK